MTPGTWFDRQGLAEGTRLLHIWPPPPPPSRSPLSPPDDDSAGHLEPQIHNQNPNQNQGQGQGQGQGQDQDHPRDEQHGEQRDGSLESPRRGSTPRSTGGGILRGARYDSQERSSLSRGRSVSWGRGRSESLSVGRGAARDAHVDTDEDTNDDGGDSGGGGVRLDSPTDTIKSTDSPTVLSDSHWAPRIRAKSGDRPPDIFDEQGEEDGEGEEGDTDRPGMIRIYGNDKVRALLESIYTWVYTKVVSSIQSTSYHA